MKSESKKACSRWEGSELQHKASREAGEAGTALWEDEVFSLHGSGEIGARAEGKRAAGNRRIRWTPWQLSICLARQVTKCMMALRSPRLPENFPRTR